MSYVRCICGTVYDTVGTTTGTSGCCPKCGLHHSGQYRVVKPVLKPSPLAVKPIDHAEIMIEHTPIEYYVNHVMGEITKCDVERVSEKLRALGWEEVVRCRDCKYGEHDKGWFTPDGRLWCMRPDGDGDYMRFEVEPDGFCKWGERKE